MALDIRSSLFINFIDVFLDEECQLFDLFPVHSISALRGSAYRLIVDSIGCNIIFV